MAEVQELCKEMKVVMAAVLVVWLHVGVHHSLELVQSVSQATQTFDVCFQGDTLVAYHKGHGTTFTLYCLQLNTYLGRPLCEHLSLEEAVYNG